MNEKEAYLVGAYLSNGYAGVGKCATGTSWAFVLTAFDLDVVERSAQYIRDLFSLPVAVEGGCGDYYRARCSRKSLVEWLWKKTNQRQHLPAQVRKMDASAQRMLVAGLMDNDGWIHENMKRKPNPTYQAGIAACAPWIYDLRSLLQSCGVSCGNPKDIINHKKHPQWNPCFRFYINLRTFSERGFFFLAQRKQSRLIRYQEQVLGWNIPGRSSEAIPEGSRGLATPKRQVSCEPLAG